MVKNILVVDDDTEDLKTIESVLKTEGYNTKTVKDGAKAIDSLKTYHKNTKQWLGKTELN
ncbi:MAG: hypothetical protein CMH62_01185 [Nanoarchaeota archaeon]|nr:hypothetical protein [Nanoarchaeota archaeon]|tara:strand:- start:242 stop:421 length:180 start_codon:yes stop_codon:yes gene_type:complete